MGRPCGGRENRSLAFNALHVCRDWPVSEAAAPRRSTRRVACVGGSCLDQQPAEIAPLILSTVTDAAEPVVSFISASALVVDGTRCQTRRTVEVDGRLSRRGGEHEGGSNVAQKRT